MSCLGLMLLIGIMMMLVGAWEKLRKPKPTPAEGSAQKLTDGMAVRELCKQLKINSIEKVEGNRAYLRVPFFTATIVEMADDNSARLIRIENSQEVPCGTISARPT